MNIAATIIAESLYNNFIDETLITSFVIGLKQISSSAVQVSDQVKFGYKKCTLFFLKWTGKSYNAKTQETHEWVVHDLNETDLVFERKPNFKWPSYAIHISDMIPEDHFPTIHDVKDTTYTFEVSVHMITTQHRQDTTEYDFDLFMKRVVKPVRQT